MENTGGVSKQLAPPASRIVFGDTAGGDFDDQLWPMTEVDRAHVVMLHEQGLLRADLARSLLDAIAEPRADGFATLRGRPVPRGLYLMYEDHLIDRLGVVAGGSLHTGRSRNDLKATVLALQSRAQVRSLIKETIRLLAVLLARARRNDHVVMPIYTHFQPTVPVTYGHYLLGVATALDRDLLGLEQAADGLRTSPMGACGAGGTDLPLNPDRVARLLGFERVALNSIDAVASRDTSLRLLSAATSTALTLSRLATDLQLWSTQEFGFVGLPDELVGTSSILPQKRNAFLLEHIKAKPAIVAATAQALVSSAKGTPFTNSIEVGTEGVAAQTTGLRAVGPRSVADQYTILRAKWSAHLASHRHWGARLRTSTDELEKAVHEL